MGGKGGRGNGRRETKRRSDDGGGEEEGTAVGRLKGEAKMEEG